MVIVFLAGACVAAAAVVCLEKLPQILRRLRRPRFAWKQFGRDAWQAQRDVLLCQLRSGCGVPVPRYPGTSQIEMSLAKMSLKRSPMDWWWSLAAYAALDAGTRQADAQARDGALNHLGRLVDSQGSLIQVPELPEHCLAGEVFLQAFKTTGDAKYRAAAEQVVRRLLAWPRSPSGLVPYLPGKPKVLLVDTLGMICPLLAAWGRETGDASATELAVHQLEDFIEAACPRPQVLPAHAHEDGTKTALGVIGWARGCGWFALGLVGVLEQLPAQLPAAQRLRDALSAFAASMRASQAESGCWRWAVSDPYAAEDASGTAMVGLALARAVDGGLLAHEFRAVAENAARGVAGVTDSGGVVWQCQGNTFWIGLYAHEFLPALWGQAAAVALGTRLLPEVRAGSRGA
jgi:unsaturated rhamnogalacturonyl hydrolase